MTGSASYAEARSRRNDIDWLRIGATFLLFPFHVAKTFDVGPAYHLKNADLTTTLDLFTFFIHQWHMPLFFLLAGWSACGAIRRHGVRGFRRERVRRLFVPLLLVSLFACPVLKYLELSCGLTITARIQMDAGIPGKIALMLVTAVVSTMAAYHFAVRPTPALRLALGMPPLRAS